MTKIESGDICRANNPVPEGVPAMVLVLEVWEGLEMMATNGGETVVMPLDEEKHFANVCMVHPLTEDEITLEKQGWFQLILSRELTGLDYRLKVHGDLTVSVLLNQLEKVYASVPMEVVEQAWSDKDDSCPFADEVLKRQLFETLQEVGWPAIEALADE